MNIIAALALRFGLPRWVIVLIGSLALLALVAGGAAWWLSRHDKRVIEADRLQANVEALQKDRAATRAADRNQAKAEGEDRARAEAVQKEIDNAVAAHPEEARRPVGPATSAALDRLRKRQTGDSKAAR